MNLNTDHHTVSLARGELRGRTFLLGNKRAFSLSLPASSGNSDVLFHPHKWFGAYQYGRKYLEAQVLRLFDRDKRVLGERFQTGFTLGLTVARREYEVEGVALSEEFFVPDGVDGFVCRIDGALPVTVEPELDMRYSSSLHTNCDGYQTELQGDTFYVHSVVSGGRYDDATESLIPDASVPAIELWAAVALDGDATWIEELPASHHTRRKVFARDLHRSRFIRRWGADAADHAPLWNQCSSRVYAPVRLHIPAGGVVTYGFGSTREAAERELRSLRGNLVAFQAQKSDSARAVLRHASLSTGSDATDEAYAQVLTRLTDGLVARQVTPGGTAIQQPSTMILAGNQYFHDSWKRDENIALGFLLTLGFYELARSVIHDSWQLQDHATGRLPQRIRTGEDPPYHSSDGTLWALIRLYQYWRCSGDESLLIEKLPLVEHFFRRSLDRIVDGMLPSGRTTHPEYLWETWMDTPHTPRDGFPVEIQLLWLRALSSYAPVFERHDPALADAMRLALRAARRAIDRFDVGGFLADSLDPTGAPRELLTPNAFFSFGLGVDLGAELESALRRAGRDHLAGAHGIRTLAPIHWDREFSTDLLEDSGHVRGRRMRSIGKYNYHRGVEWNWLAFFFVLAELKYGGANTAFRRYLRPQVRTALSRDGIGGISELHDLSGARGPDYQAWSMAGFLEALHAFAGVQIDVPDRSIAIRPQLPDAWTHIDVRKWYGGIPFEVRYRALDGGQQLEVAFPERLPPDVRLDVVLPLPARTAAEFVDAQLDSVPQSPSWVSRPMPGTDRMEVSLSLPAARHVEISTGTRRIGALKRVG